MNNEMKILKDQIDKFEEKLERAYDKRHFIIAQYCACKLYKLKNKYIELELAKYAPK